VNPHLGLGGDWTYHRIDFSDRFLRVHEAAARVDFAVTPNLFGAVATQWNNEDDEAIVNFRLNWIPTPGSDLFLVINQIADARVAPGPLCAPPCSASSSGASRSE